MPEVRTEGKSYWCERCRVFHKHQFFDEPALIAMAAQGIADAIDAEIFSELLKDVNAVREAD